MIERKLEKYLRTRATTIPWQLEGCSGTDLKAAVVIPALAEFETLPLTLNSLAQNPAELLARTLVVVVINNRASASSTGKLANRHTLDWLRSVPYSELNLAWVDAASSGLELPEKEGVGLARKIGFDLVLEYLNWGTDPLLISLDADSLVDGSYLRAIFRHFQTDPCAGAYLPFRHQIGESEAQESAIRNYELYLRSYQYGLSWAGSPYAFISIGSALACRAAAYVAAGGMKRRQAGEDFYFLQQLVKTGGVGPLRGTVVRPAARYSGRVPFGTGRTLEAAVEQNKNLYRFISYPSFQLLKNWLETVGLSQTENACHLLDKAEQISPILNQFLVLSDFSSVWQKLQKQSSGTQFVAAWHNWFDGLKTRQLLRCFEQEKAGSAPDILIAELLGTTGYPNRTRCSEQLVLFEKLQGVLAP